MANSGINRVLSRRASRPPDGSHAGDGAELPHGLIREDERRGNDDDNKAQSDYQTARLIGIQRGAERSAQHPAEENAEGAGDAHDEHRAQERAVVGFGGIAEIVEGKRLEEKIAEHDEEARAQGESGGQYEEEGGAPAEYQRHAAVERVKADAHIAEAYGRDDDSGKHDAGEGLYERSAGERIFGDGGTAREESEHEGVQGKTDGPAA